METLRREKIDLEIRVKTLEASLKEAETSTKGREEVVEKAQTKLEKYKHSIDEHKVCLRSCPTTITGDVASRQWRPRANGALTEGDR